MNKTVLVLCAGLIMALGGGSQAYSQAAAEYGVTSAAASSIAGHGAPMSRIYQQNARAFAHRSSASGATVKKSNGRTAQARVVRRGPTQQPHVANAAPPVQHSDGIQMTIVGAAHE